MIGRGSGRRAPRFALLACALTASQGALAAPATTKRRPPAAKVTSVTPTAKSRVGRPFQGGGRGHVEGRRVGQAERGSPRHRRWADHRRCVARRRDRGAARARGGRTGALSAGRCRRHAVAERAPVAARPRTERAARAHLGAPAGAGPLVTARWPKAGAICTGWTGWRCPICRSAGSRTSSSTSSSSRAIRAVASSSRCGCAGRVATAWRCAGRCGRRGCPRISSGCR